MPTIISHKLKLIFCHVPRTGGTSFTEAITPFLGVEDDLDSFDKHTPLHAIRNSRYDKIFQKYMKVFIYRNEAERIESLEKNPPINVMPGSEYWWSTDKWIDDPKTGVPLADVALTFASLEQSVKKFMASRGILIADFPHLNKR